MGDLQGRQSVIFKPQEALQLNGFRKQLPELPLEPFKNTVVDDNLLLYYDNIYLCFM